MSGDNEEHFTEYEVDDEEGGITNTGHGEDDNSVDVESVTHNVTKGVSGGLASPSRPTYDEGDTNMMMANALLNLNKGHVRPISRAQYQTTCQDEQVNTTLQEEEAVPDAPSLEGTEIEKLRAQIALLQAALEDKI